MIAANIAMSGMAAARARLDASAQNLANQDTPGYRPVRAVQTTRQDGGVAANLHRESPPVFVAPDLAPPSSGWPTVEGSWVDPGLELIEQMQALHELKANLKVFETTGEVTQSLLDIKA